jgi:hypothetical protein
MDPAWWRGGQVQFLFCTVCGSQCRRLTEIFINNYRRGIPVVAGATPEVCSMADKNKPTEISSAKVIGIGVVLFIVIVVIWYLILK